ncbi:MAG: glycosyltransferase family 2 protein [Bacteroidales bacterium]|nr:glycosyltransferase family 2 protein [Bacteroidales bacterium]
MKLVAVAILNWNGEDLLKKFLPIVLENTSSEIANVYVIDNGSSDNSVKFVRENFPLVKVIELGNNYGFAEGYNKGIQYLSEKYVILLNSDVEVTTNWIVPMLELMERDENIGACQPKILSYSKRSEFEYAGACGGFIDKFGYPFCRGRLFNVFEEDFGQYDFASPIFWASGACIMTRTELYKSIGGLDADFFAHMEEIDYCWRLWARGFKVYCVPNSVVYHVGGATLSKTNPHKTFLNFRNNLFLLYKNLPSEFFSVFFIRYLLDFIAFIKFIFSCEFNNAFSVIKAHYYFVLSFKKIKIKRKENLSKTLIKNIPVIYKGSVVIEFFIKKKRKFNELGFKYGINKNS